jgi:hypothetical protein
MAFSFSFVDLDGADESFVQEVLDHYNLGVLDKIVTTRLYDCDQDQIKFDVYYLSRNEKGKSFCHDLELATQKQTTLRMKHGYNFVTDEHIVWNLSKT